MNKEAWDRLGKLEEEAEALGYTSTIGPALAPVCKVCGKRVWRPAFLAHAMCKCPKEVKAQQ
jgi:hypothetical protein